VDDALLAAADVVELDAELGAVLAQVEICLAAIWSTMLKRSASVVGTLWSTVAMQRSGRRTCGRRGAGLRRPAAR
jgi:hypothetical protein